MEGWSGAATGRHLSCLVLLEKEAGRGSLEAATEEGPGEAEVAAAVETRALELRLRRAAEPREEGPAGTGTANA